MAYDYAPALALAIRSVAKYGRPVSFAKSSEAIADPALPLHGPGIANPPVVVPGIMAAFVQPSGINRLGTSSNRASGLWLEIEQLALVAPDGINDLDQFTELTDTDGSTWKIHVAERFAPGDTVLLYYIGVKR